MAGNGQLNFLIGSIHRLNPGLPFSSNRYVSLGGVAPKKVMTLIENKQKLGCANRDELS